MLNGAYTQFIERVRELHAVRSIEALLDWDQETMMPRRGAEARADQLAVIAGVVHDRLTADEIGRLLGQLEQTGLEPESIEGVNVREMRRLFDRATRLPRSLVQELARVTVLAKETWQQARMSDRFGAFAASLRRIVELKREEAERLRDGRPAYDALLDEYEPGMTAAELNLVFGQLRAELMPLVAKLSAAGRRPREDVLTRHCPQAAQAVFARELTAAIGFDHSAGRIDVSAHPFCSGFSPGDVRLTNRFDERYVPMSIFGILHEAGHGMYEQGYDAALRFTPMATATSLGIHESQSRMWENQVGRSRPFWEHFFPKLQAAFPSMQGIALDDWHFAINAVRPSFIRVEADEATYALHIILRFDLEQRMLSGALAIEDVPAAWNSGMRDLLGITPPNDKLGCLQDIHWSSGILGYFPTYALGNLYAAQFYSAAMQQMPDLEDRFRRGDFRALLEWLRANIHQHGRRYRAKELVRRVTGSELSPAPFLSYLKAKGSALYGVQL